MNLAILGAAKVGGALGQALGRAGHDIVFGVRRPNVTQPNQASIAVAMRDMLWTELGRKRGFGPDIAMALLRNAHKEPMKR